MNQVSEVLKKLKQEGRQYFNPQEDIEDLVFVMTMQGLAFEKRNVVVDGQSRVRIKLKH